MYYILQAKISLIVLVLTFHLLPKRPSVKKVFLTNSGVFSLSKETFAETLVDLSGENHLPICSFLSQQVAVCCREYRFARFCGAYHSQDIVLLPERSQNIVVFLANPSVAVVFCKDSNFVVAFPGHSSVRYFFFPKRSFKSACSSL